MQPVDDKVLVNHEIDHNPNPEDAGRIKVNVRIQLSEISDPIIDCPTVLAFSLPAKEFWDDLVNYRWNQLNCLEEDERLLVWQVKSAREKLRKHVFDVMFNSNNYSDPVCAFLIDITFNIIPRMSIEDYVRYRDSLEVTIFEDYRPVSLDETTIDIRFGPARKFAVESLSRKIYEKTSSISDMCTICLDEFKVGERVVTLPCGHEFHDNCIIEWFATNHVCPLCPFRV